jgi:ABC-type bacteriocin/lantibiotic exporter with double-glycine peptidase domain
MLLKYYGGYVSKKNLTDMTKTNKNGTTAYHIKETLNNLGFSSTGIRRTLDEMNKTTNVSGIIIR